MVQVIDVDYVNSLRGKYKGKGPMKVLMNEKDWEKNTGDKSVTFVFTCAY